MCIRDRSCFSGSQLKKVHILRKNKKIGAYVFEGCKKLKKATIEKGVKNISDGMFRATALKNITCLLYTSFGRCQSGGL